MAEKAKTMAALARMEDDIQKRNALAIAEQEKAEKEHAEKIAREKAAAEKRMEEVRIAESKARQQRLEDKAARAEARASRAKAEADKVKQQAFDKRARVEAKMRAREEKANRAAAKAKRTADVRRAKAIEAAKLSEELTRRVGVTAESSGNPELEDFSQEGTKLPVTSHTDTVSSKPASPQLEKGPDRQVETEDGTVENGANEKPDHQSEATVAAVKQLNPETKDEFPSKTEVDVSLEGSAVSATVTSSILSQTNASLVTPLQSREHRSDSADERKTEEHFSSFLSPRGSTSNRKPKLHNFTALDLGLSDVDGDGIISARDVSRTIQNARDEAVKTANMALAQRLEVVQSHYNHKRFEESYQQLIHAQRQFSETLMWDRDPRKRHMPISPRLTHFPKILSPDE